MRTLYFLVQEIKDSAASQETGLEKIDNRAICNIKALTKTKAKVNIAMKAYILPPRTQKSCYFSK